MFKVFDKDANDEIQIEELRFVLKSCLVDSEEIEECLAFYDIEKNGKLSFKSIF